MDDLVSQSDNAPGTTAGTAELRAALERALGHHFGVPRRIVELGRRLSTRRTSFAIEELDVGLDDGTLLKLVLKDLSWQSMPECVRRVKPEFLYDPLREIEAYQTLLGPHQVGAPVCYGAVVDLQLGRYWLFLELVPEIELHHMGDFSIWLEVARWLAGMHSKFAGQIGPLARSRTAHLLRFDADYYRLWMSRAREFARGRSGTSCSAEVRSRLEWLGARYDRVIERLVALPSTFIHGEFYASNVLVRETALGLSVRPVDWEMAAQGPGLMDVAALAAGAWTEEEKSALALTYRTELRSDRDWPSAVDEFLTAFHCCRLHLAIQWLGWSPEWSPPFDNAQDWLSEALRLAEELDA
jgi:hypothetical protein